MERTWAIWAVVGRHKQAEMEFRCRNDVDLEPKEPKFDNQCGLSQINAIRASDIWRGRPQNIRLNRIKIERTHLIMCKSSYGINDGIPDLIINAPNIVTPLLH